MQIEFLAIIDHRLQENFINFLNRLVEKQTSEAKKDLIKHVLVPIVQNDGIIPEGPDFANLLAKLNVSGHQIPMELEKLYILSLGEDRRVQGGSRQLPTSLIFNTAQVAHLTGLSPRRVRELARINELPGAMKQGRRWVFLRSLIINRKTLEPLF